MIEGSKIELVDFTDTNWDQRYSLSEIDILCRKCNNNLGHIIHICTKQLVTECSNCGYIATIDTSFVHQSYVDVHKTNEVLTQ
jgi:hypothetical protein